MPDVVELHYTPGGFYRPGVGDREYGKGARPGPSRCVLPRWGGTAPVGHALSAVVAFMPAGSEVTSFGVSRDRWVRLSRVACGCGRAWGRAVPSSEREVARVRAAVLAPVRFRSGGDDVALRGDHAGHCRTVRKATT